MKFSVSTSQPQKLSVSKTAMKRSIADMLSDAEAIHRAWEDLSDTHQELEAISTCMANIDISISILNKFGNAAVETLNMDGGLSDLLGCAENMITAKSALEALDEGEKGFFARFWEKVKEFVRKIIAWVKMLFRAGLGGWDEKSLQALKIKINSIDAVANNVFHLRGNVLNGVLTKEGFVNLPPKIVEFLKVANEHRDQLTDIARSFRSAMVVYLGGQKDNTHLFTDEFTEVSNKLNALDDSFHKKTLQIFGTVGPDAKVGLFAFNFRWGNWITNKSGFVKGNIFSESLNKLGFNTKSDFLQALQGFEVLEKGLKANGSELQKMADGTERLGNEILSFQHILEGMQKAYSDDVDRKVNANSSGLFEFIRKLYAAERTSAQWIADAVSVRKAMTHQFGLMLQACFSGKSAGKINDEIKTAEDEEKERLKKERGH